MTQETHESALVRLRNASPRERDAVEHAYIQALEAICEDALRRDPLALAPIVSAVPLELLAVSRNRDLVHYYRSLATGLHDQYDEALRLLNGLLSHNTLDATVRGRALNSAALFAQSLGQYQYAQSCYVQSYAIWHELGNTLRQGLARTNLGALLYELHEYDEAERCFREAVELFTSARSAYHQAQAYNELGLLCRDRGQWDEAMTHLHHAAALCEDEQAIELLARVTNNLGEVELLRGAYEAAARAFDRAETGMSTRIYQVDIHINRGLLAQVLRDDQAALGHYKAGLELALAIGRGEIVPMLYYRIGLVERRLKQLDAAHRSFAAAVAAVEERRVPVRDEGLLISLMGRWQSVYEVAIDLCLERGDAAGAFDYAECSRARAFTDLLAQRHLDLPVDAEAPLTGTEVQARLPHGTLLLCYFAGGMRGPETALLDAMPHEAEGLKEVLRPPVYLVRFAVSNGTLRAERCPLDPNALHAASRHLADGQRFLRPAILRRCYDALVAPADDLFAESQQVVIVPHGPLHQLPFAALLDAHDRSLVDKVQLSYAPSATLLLCTREQHVMPKRTCLAVGFAGSDHQVRHTEHEARTVASVCAGDLLAPGEDVLERFLSCAGAYRMLHLACHGEFNVDAPLESFLEIGPGAQLAAADALAHLRMSAELVTLSACRSGVSRVLRGDEPMGLVRAFLVAGARAVLVTLWQVEDESARVLMEHMYRTLVAQGKETDPAAALRKAQLALRQYVRPDGTRPFAMPQFWAPYALVSVGD